MTSPIKDYVVIGILKQIGVPTRFVSPELELTLAPCAESNPEFMTRILPYEAAESFLVSWNAFWKYAKPWRVEMRRREVSV